MNLFLRIATILLFVGWRWYWSVTEKKADKEKPKTQATPLFDKRRTITLYGLRFVIILFVMQLLFGVQILSMPDSGAVPMIGLGVVILGLGLAVLARQALGSNWANGYEYQIKERHELITSGVYAFIRHPIYTGLVVAVIGAELVAMSYLFIIFFFGFWIAYVQAKAEETILEKHFGKKYTDYKKHSKMLIPFIF